MGLGCERVSSMMLCDRYTCWMDWCMCVRIVTMQLYLQRKIYVKCELPIRNDFLRLVCRYEGLQHKTIAYVEMITQLPCRKRTKIFTFCPEMSGTTEFDKS
ncbi:hypothetical protein PILCRDRAFT_257397 [Piloderma croceum F 1598]|uniref:Uncharacterized protein n=1 Tax=Piloderma croceum (strain F 1598) TaxID=765440 RepID=A0A0C3G9P9_PILCF|nr:hypothetical protein PILCRDRAFT_257397 [Piloderma croceum F 1598]